MTFAHRRLCDEGVARPAEGPSRLLGRSGTLAAMEKTVSSSRRQIGTVHRPKMIRVCLSLISLAAAVTVAGCGDEARDVVAADTQEPLTTSTAPTTNISGTSTVFGGLTVTVTLSSPEVAANAELTSRMTYFNQTSADLSINDCGLSTWASAIVPTGDPSPDLWLRPIPNCAGPQIVEPGTGNSQDGPLFISRNKYGEHLAPGPYEAVYKLDGQILRIPVTITGATPTPGDS